MEENRLSHETHEIHSEKVRRMMGSIPSPLVRWGMFIIIALSVALIASLCLLPYPYSHGESILRHVIDLYVCDR